MALTEQEIEKIAELLFHYGYELHKLEKLLEEYVYNEEYEKADVIKNKIRLLRIKIKKL